MNKKEDIKRISKLLQELNFRTYDESKSEELWEIFSHEGFEKTWLKTTDKDLQVALEYINKVDTVTINEVVQLENPMLYFILWLIRVYEKTKEEK